MVLGIIMESGKLERIHAHKTTGWKTGRQQPHYKIAKGLFIAQ